VHVRVLDVETMAHHLDLTPAALAQRHLKRVHGRLCLLERPDGDCTLLDPLRRTCLVYPVRPLQCRLWPWWSVNLASPEAWQAAARECPGIGQGSLQDVSRAREQQRRA